MAIMMIYFIQILLVHTTSVDVSKYKGDGIIKKSGYGLIASGFEIEFDKFNINNQNTIKYTLKNLPTLKKEYIFYMRVHKTFNKEIIDKMKNTTVVFRLFQDNKKLVDINSKLSEWTATSLSGNKTIDYFYFDKKIISGLKSLTPNREIIVEFSYAPGQKALLEDGGDVGLILKVGGSK